MTQLVHLADMAVGYCSYENCRWRNTAIECLSCDKDMPNDVPFNFVQLTHTMPSRCGPTCNNPQMHSNCFRAFQKQMLKMIRTDMCDAEKEKAIWTQKYDMIQKHAHCRCGGKVKPILLGARDEIATSEPQSEEPKTRKKSKKKAQIYVKPKELDFDLDDETIQQYVWKGDTPAPEEPEPEPEPELQSFDMCFPKMPIVSIERPKAQQRSQQRTVKLMPSIASRVFSDYHMLSLSNDRITTWMPRIIGKQGKTLKDMDRKHATRTSIDENKATNTVRIYIYYATPEARSDVASILSTRIVKYLSA